MFFGGGMDAIAIHSYITQEMFMRQPVFPATVYAFKRSTAGMSHLRDEINKTFYYPGEFRYTSN
jgi:hypothetical protein